MNDFIDDFANFLAEKQLQLIIWQKLKKDWWEPEYVKQLYIDDEENILAVNIDNSIIIIGYLHLNNDLHKQSNFQDTILKYTNQFASDLIKISSQHGWNKRKIIISTTYKLSNYDGIDFSSLSSDVNYFYITKSPQAENKNYEMKPDQDMVDLKSNERMFKKFLSQSEKYNSQINYWNCHLCGGNKDTGCLYFDPTECPKFN